MNIAVLIGVSEYSVVDPLPACSADVEQMRRLLHATNKYAEICCITSNTSATPLKEALRSFFTRHQSAGPIEEALVYFSGHGVYHNDVLLCCSDFDPNRPTSTSVSNAEIDDLLRSVTPAVAVKIIDACQSGSPYIKDVTPGFEKALRESRLQAFICMASSRADQSSYATAECSVFTDRLVAAALSKSEGTVLYRDIQAALADAFVANPEQTPFFVIQGTGLEMFATVTSDMRTLALARSKLEPTAQTEDTLVTRIVAEVDRLDALYVSADVAAHAIEQAGNNLDCVVLSHPLIAQFYDKRVTRGGKLLTLPRRRAVAEFAKEQGWEKKYFVKIEEESYLVKVPKDPIASLLGRHLGDEDYAVETRYRPGHLEATQPLPFEVAEVTFEPKDHPSLKAFIVYVGLVHSLTELVVLSAVARFIETGWTERAAELSQLQWRYQSHLWKDVVTRPELIWEDPLSRGKEAIVTYLESLVPKKDEAAVGLQSTSEATKTSVQGREQLTTRSTRPRPASGAE